MNRQQRRAQKRHQAKRIREVKANMATAPAPARHVAPSNALLQEGTGFLVFMNNVPAWPYPAPTRDGAQQILDRLRRELSKNGYDPRVETLEIRLVELGPT